MDTILRAKGVIIKVGHILSRHSCSGNRSSARDSSRDGGRVADSDGAVLGLALGDESAKMVAPRLGDFVFFWRTGNFFTGGSSSAVSRRTDTGEICENVTTVLYGWMERLESEVWLVVVKKILTWVNPTWVNPTSTPHCWEQYG